MNRLAADADRQWRPRTPPSWVRPAGTVLMVAIVVAVVVAVRSGLA